MTIREMVEQKIPHMARSGWGPGEYVHLLGIILDRKTDKPVGYRACFCHAPIPGNHPDCEDDLWMPYTGSDAPRMYEGPKLPGNLLLAPSEVLQAVSEIATMIVGLALDEEPEEVAEVQGQVPETPFWSVGPTMSA